MAFEHEVDVLGKPVMHQGVALKEQHRNMQWVVLSPAEVMLSERYLTQKICRVEAAILGGKSSSWLHCTTRSYR